MRRAERATRPGAALLEVIVALAIFAVSGAALVAMSAESLRAVTRARDAGAEIRAADAFFNAVALWPREDLDRHLGDRHQGRWIMRVDRPGADVYEVSLRDSTTGGVLLRTSLYRPEAPRATP
jgi:type II secretory pathway pseudopilin PulG